MNITTIIGGVFAIAKAIPIVNKWLNELVDAVNEKRVLESDQIRETFKQEKKALNRAIEKAGTDEDIKYLSITLHRLNGGELSKSKDSGKVL